MLHFEIDQNQYDTLLGLRHWMALKAKLKELYPDEYEKEAERIHNTILFNFDHADKLKIPFWVQNIVCYFQDDWRHCADTHLYQDLEKRGVDCSAVSCR